MLTAAPARTRAASFECFDFFRFNGDSPIYRYSWRFDNLSLFCSSGQCDVCQVSKNIREFFSF